MADSFRKLVNSALFESLVHAIHSKRRFIQKLNTAVLLTDAQQFYCGFIGNILIGKIEQKHNIYFKLLLNTIFLFTELLYKITFALVAFGHIQHSCDIAYVIYLKLI